MSLPVATGRPGTDVRAVFSADDYPDYLLAADLSGTVYTRTTVRPDGTIQDCVAEISSTDPKLDAYTCGIIVKRAKFRPATWTDGTPVYGVIRVPVKWIVVANDPPSREESLKATMPDIDLYVDRLPKGAQSIVSVSLEIAADEKGHPVTCAEDPPTDRSDSQRRFPELVPIACQQAMGGLVLRPPVDAAGKSVRSVQGASVHFRVKH
jgi:TonB family protein